MAPHEYSDEESIRSQEVAAALRAEFAEAEKYRGPRTSTIKDIEDLKEDALVALRHTIKHSQNEGLKTKVSMWAIDKLLDASKVADSPMEEFFKEMAVASPPTKEDG